MTSKQDIDEVKLLELVYVLFSGRFSSQILSRIAVEFRFLDGTGRWNYTGVYQSHGYNNGRHYIFQNNSICLGSELTDASLDMVANLVLVYLNM